MFAIIHCFEVDAEYGMDPREEEVIGLVKTEEEAKAYINKWKNVELYDAGLAHKDLRYEKIRFLDIHEDPFGDYESPWYYNYRRENFKFKED